VFRGISTNPVDDPIPKVFQTIACTAIESAQAVVNLISTDGKLRAVFVRLPHYFQTMIAFACSFLLRTATKHRAHITIDRDLTFSMIREVIQVCDESHSARYHLIYWIGKGLNRLLISCETEVARRAKSLANRPTDIPALTEIEELYTTNGTRPTVDYPKVGAASVNACVDPWDFAREQSMLQPADFFTHDPNDIGYAPAPWYPLGQPRSLEDGSL
jgi:hypothetical protein